MIFRTAAARRRHLEKLRIVPLLLPPEIPLTNVVGQLKRITVNKMSRVSGNAPRNPQAQVVKKNVSVYVNTDEMLLYALLRNTYFHLQNRYYNDGSLRPQRTRRKLRKPGSGSKTSSAHGAADGPWCPTSTTKARTTHRKEGKKIEVKMELISHGGGRRPSSPIPQKKNRGFASILEKASGLSSVSSGKPINKSHAKDGCKERIPPTAEHAYSQGRILPSSKQSKHTNDDRTMKTMKMASSKPVKLPPIGKSMLGKGKKEEPRNAPKEPAMDMFYNVTPKPKPYVDYNNRINNSSNVVIPRFSDVAVEPRAPTHVVGLNSRGKLQRTISYRTLPQPDMVYSREMKLGQKNDVPIVQDRRLPKLKDAVQYGGPSNPAHSGRHEDSEVCQGATAANYEEEGKERESKTIKAIRKFWGPLINKRNKHSE